MLQQVRIVLVNPSHPGNIGAAARAMKTMGLTKLCLVSPADFPHHKADEMASGASDILKEAIVMESLDEAIADCSLVVGTSARMRTIPWPLVTPNEMALKIKEEHADNQIAILFGREQSGLNNQELERCHLHVQIPANPNYSSLNLAAAVQIISYELNLMSLNKISNVKDWDYRLANANEMEMFFKHLQDVLIAVDFLKMNAPRKLMTRLRRLFLRARPDIMEINMLRGMLSAVQELKKYSNSRYKTR